MAAIPISVMSFPTRMVVGPGALSRLPDEMAGLGARRALIVSDRGIEAAGIVQRVEEVLAQHGFSGGSFLGVSANPREGDVLKGVEAFRELGADVVLGLGGGGPMDVAKAVALKVTHDRPLVDYDDLAGGSDLISERMPPIIAIPTTAGTGSEVGRAGVIVLGETARKVVIFSPHLLPKVALCDAELTVGLPAHLTAATGVDAMTHALEAYVARGDHPFADMYALGALARVSLYLERAVANGSDMKARHEMMLAASMAAISFQKGLGACHALAHPLGSVADVHHGLANAILLPHIVAYNFESALLRYALAGRAMGVDPSIPVKDGAEACLRRVVEIIKGSGIQRTLSEEGVTEETIEKMVPQALADACAPQNPRELTEESVRGLYKAAL